MTSKHKEAVDKNNTSGFYADDVLERDTGHLTVFPYEYCFWNFFPDLNTGLNVL